MSALKHEDRIRLDQRAARKRRDTDRGARRIRLVEIAGHDLVDAGEMREIGQIDGELHRIGERSARRLGDRLEISKDAIDLALDSVDKLPGLRVQADLSGVVTMQTFRSAARDEGELARPPLCRRRPSSARTRNAR